MATLFHALRASCAPLYQLGNPNPGQRICRVLAAHQDELEDFLDRGLMPQIQEVFSKRKLHTTATAQPIAADGAALDLEQPSQSPASVTSSDALASVDTHAAEQEVYKHLCRFLRRYYATDAGAKRHWGNYTQRDVRLAQYYSDPNEWNPYDRKHITFQMIRSDAAPDNAQLESGDNFRVLLHRDNPVTLGIFSVTVNFEDASDERKRDQRTINKDMVSQLLEILSGDLNLSTQKKMLFRQWISDRVTHFARHGAFDHISAGFLRREINFYIANEITPYDDSYLEIPEHLHPVVILLYMVHNLVDLISQTHNIKKELAQNKTLSPVIEFNKNYGAQNYALSQCFVSDVSVTKQPIVFIDINKNMSTSVISLLNAFKAGSVGPIDFSDIASHGHPKLIVIRNPLQRAISSFFQMAKMGNYYAHCSETIQTEWFQLLVDNQVEKSFELFLNYIEDRFYDTHVFPQHQYLENKGLSLSDVEYVIIQEEFASGFEALSKSLNVNLIPKKRNVSTTELESKYSNERSYFSRFFRLFSRDLSMIQKTRAVYYRLHPKLSLPQVVPQAYAALHSHVDNNVKIQEKIKQVYHKDFVLYEEACARAL